MPECRGRPYDEDRTTSSMVPELYHKGIKLPFPFVNSLAVEALEFHVFSIVVLAELGPVRKISERGKRRIRLT